MQHIPVNSSSIATVGHDPETGVLEVTFANGGCYAYTGVSADDVTALLAAKSIGSHFSTHVRGKFEHKKVDVEKVETP